MRKIYFLSCFLVFGTWGANAQMMVEDASATVQRQTQFAKSLQQTIEQLRIANKTLQTGEESLSIFNDVTDGFMAMSVISDITNKVSNIMDNYERTKTYIESGNLNPEEKALYMTRLTSLLGEAVSESKDFKTILSSSFKSDSGNRYKVLKDVNKSLDDINSKMALIARKAKLRVKDKKRQSDINRMIFLGY